MAAVTNRRIARRAEQNAGDSVAARLYAQAAIRLGLLAIERDPDWRFKYHHGAWMSDVPIAGGTYTLEGLDPSDSDLDDSPKDPVVLRGTGKQGRSVHTMQITLATENRGFTALEAAIHAGEDVRCDDATIYCDQIISANDSVEADDCAIYSDVEAVRDISGSAYYGAKKKGIDARTLPVPSSVLEYYLTYGTPIDKASIPIGNPNALQNPGAEEGTEHWYALDDQCKLAASNDAPHSGNFCLRVTQRNNFTTGPAQDVTGQVLRGAAFNTSVWIRPKDSRSFRIYLRLSTSNGITTIALTPLTWLKAGVWTELSGMTTISWFGTLNKAEWYISSEPGSLVNFDIDNADFKEVGSERTIANVLLSPSNNPYGATNSQGIYVIDLGGSRLAIKRSRIVGTLVLLNPDDDTRIGANTPLHWEPAVAGFPSLIVHGEELTINPSDDGLVEAHLRANFNPPSTPYEGEADLDQLDTYPSQIKGLIYSDDRLYFDNRPVVHGAVIAADRIEIEGVLRMTYNPTYYRNPPPGFSGPEEIRILLNSAKKTLN